MFYNEENKKLWMSYTFDFVRATDKGQIPV